MRIMTTCQDPYISSDTPDVTIILITFPDLYTASASPAIVLNIRRGPKMALDALSK